MFLFHNTNLKTLKYILKDGYLKSYSLLKKDGFNMSKIKNEGIGLYEENKFVYFSCVDELFNENIIGNVTLYFNSELLFNRTFWVANLHSPDPDYLGEWKTNDGRLSYKRKYNKYYKKYKLVLKKLYRDSISVLKDKKGFQVFNQIAILNKINLKNLVAIEFKNKSDATSKIINYINKYYPNIKINLFSS